VKGGGEIISSELSVPSLNPGGTVDLYALAEKAGNDVRFSLWIKMPQGFLSSHAYPDQYRDAEALLKRFGVEVNKEKIRIELAEQEKELANLEKEMKRLQADNAKFHKEIEDANARIKKAEENIVQNEKDQKLSEDKIVNQKKSVDAVRKRLEQQR
jgi:valyl-tRNA synthetase